MRWNSKPARRIALEKEIEEEEAIRLHEEIERERAERAMGEDLLTSLSMENHHPSTLLSMDPSGGPALLSTHEDFSDRELMIQRPPDINLPLSSVRSPPQQSWSDILDVGLGSQVYDTEAVLHLPRVGAARKCAKRGDSIWGAWFFFSFYFKPALSEKSKAKITRDGNGALGFDKSEL